ncbi:uncharacterized protein LOC113291488 [Papaver somniferum]|uniref:uncharacterized protein LOC113291488 n=1 Tax=Papaver somniferum TaxID=3469 RepID=UPI000E6F9B5C|nr:uncharacterized protein LOC113291488 [Papaver somniferum]
MDGLNFKSIPADLGEWLERDIDEQEVINAIKLLGKTKSPGPDGYPIAFCQHTWSIIKLDAMKVVSELQSKGFLDWRLKHTFTTLILKKDLVEEFKDLRPISLANGVYKILCKVLAERFKVLLPHAFDHVNWKFLDNALEKTGYALSVMMCKSQDDGYLRGCRVSANGTMVSYLQFVDDTLTFLDVEVSKSSSSLFELLTSVRIDFAKSHMYSVGYDDDVSHFTSLFGCYNSTLPTSYLGLPLGDKYKRIHKWDIIVDRFTSNLAG